MKEFELPTNIRQIGGVDDRLRIYVEDYAISYMKRFAESGGDSDRLAFLVGKYMVIDSQGYLFICGTIQGKYTTRDDGAEVFGEESYEYANECLEKYFNGYEIVGWMQSQPGYGTSLNPVCGDYHMNNFIKPYHALLVFDPIEKLESFYLWEKNMSAMIEAKGYFVYYERNNGMQEYILDNKLSGVKSFSRAKAGGDNTGQMNINADGRALREPSAKAPRAPKPASAAVKRTSDDYKRVFNMLVSLAAVMFVVCFIMGAGLVQSDNRIGELKEELGVLVGTYGYMQNQINLLSAQPVFAAGDHRLPADGVVRQEAEATPAPIVYEPQEVRVIYPENTVTPQPATPEPTRYPGEESAASAAPPAPPSETPNASAERTYAPEPSSGVQLPKASLPPSQGSVTIPSSSPSPTPNVGLTREDALEALINLEGYDTYTVQRGDSLTSICVKYYGNTDMIEKVMQVNGITHPDRIFFGRVLLMPVADGLADNAEWVPENDPAEFEDE